MRMKDYFFTSESVTEGHPDKMADQISDAILDAIISSDTSCRVACETLITTGMVLVAGEITTTSIVDYPKVVRDTIKEIGYDSSEKGIDFKSCAVIMTLDKQSPDIARGVSRESGEEQGAGDQGLMFGYACKDTPELMPLPIILSHKLTRGLSTSRKNGILDFLLPDGKSQVTVEYRDGKPLRLDTVVIACQHREDAKDSVIKEGVVEEVIRKNVPEELWNEDVKIFINPTGRFVIGGPHGDCGLTGRKIIVDTYGGVGNHGGGAFSGKDPSKVDRSASYMARYIAKNVVAAGLAERLQVGLAYAIGVAEPLSVLVDSFGTGVIPDSEIKQRILENFRLGPGRIIKELDLLRPIYKNTAAYGHFGREGPDFTWERTDRAEALKK